METVEGGDRASSSDESESEGGMKNAYSVDDLLGELSDIENENDGKDVDLTLQHHPNDSAYPHSNVPVNGDCDVTLEDPAELNGSGSPTVDGESIECQTTPDKGGGSVSIAETSPRVYDEVLTENIYQDPAETSVPST